jgi:hypothetical protein
MRPTNRAGLSQLENQPRGVAGIEAGRDTG